VYQICALKVPLLLRYVDAVRKTPNMSRDKFIYNQQTLSYDKVEIPLKTKLLRAFGFFSAVLVSAFLLLVVLYSKYPAPREQELLKEIVQLQDKYTEVNGQLDVMSKVLANIQDRDASIHRAVFGMNPIDESQWEAGQGGHVVHPELAGFNHSKQTLSETFQKVDFLSRQLTLQSRSLDTIQQLANNQQDMLASMPSIKPVREDKLSKNMNVLSGFGNRIHPIFKVKKFHAGVDFPARQGTAIQSTGSGKVVDAGWHNGYGNCVTIDHGYGYETLYGHMHKISVKNGDTVKKGQKIGEVGDTGHSTAPHLHYEVHFKGKPINPIHFCMDNLSPLEYQELVNSANAANQSLD
jgi:murein DD-endopeptidase MepM/ murein hydrolase activator NlpD